MERDLRRRTSQIVELGILIQPDSGEVVQGHICPMSENVRIGRKTDFTRHRQPGISNLQQAAREWLKTQAEQNHNSSHYDEVMLVRCGTYPDKRVAMEVLDM